MNWGVFVSTFLAASIEVIEMVAIVVAIGVTRSWRAARVGAAGGLVVLAVTIVALGAALQGLSLETLRLVVGALLLAFGSQWYRKGILIVSRGGCGRRRARRIRLDRSLPLVQGCRARGARGGRDRRRLRRRGGRARLGDR